MCAKPENHFHSSGTSSVLMTYDQGCAGKKIFGWARLFSAPDRAIL